MRALAQAVQGSLHISIKWIVSDGNTIPASGFGQVADCCARVAQAPGESAVSASLRVMRLLEQVCQGSQPLRLTEVDGRLAGLPR